MYKYLNISLSDTWTVMTLTSSEREDSLTALLPAPSWEAGIEAESYPGLGSWESEKGTLATLPLLTSRPGSQCPTCGSERVSAYMRQGSMHAVCRCHALIIHDNQEQHSGHIITYRPQLRLSARLLSLRPAHRHDLLRV